MCARSDDIIEAGDTKLRVRGERFETRKAKREKRDTRIERMVSSPRLDITVMNSGTVFFFNPLLFLSLTLSLSLSLFTSNLSRFRSNAKLRDIQSGRKHLFQSA